MPIPQNAGSAWSYHWEPKVEHRLEPEKARPPFIIIMCAERASLMKSRFSDSYYARENEGNLWFLGNFEHDDDTKKAFDGWTRCH